MSRISDKLLNAALVAATLLCVGVWWNYYYQSRQVAAVNTATPAFEEGEVFPSQTGASLSRESASLVLFLTERCAICVESVPYYKELVTENQKLGKPLKLVAFSFDAQPTIQDFISRSGLSVDAVHAVSPDTFKLRTTPTLILVDKSGRVLKAWQGRLSDQRRVEVLEAIRATSPTTS